MSQPFPAVLGGRWSALEGGYQSNDSNGLRLPSPTAYGNLAAWYDVSDYSSLVVDGSNRVSLIADKSGNSGTNCLCLSGTVNNYASTADRASVSITSDIDLRIFLRVATYTPAADMYLIDKWTSAAGQRSWAWALTTTGAMQFFISSNGTALASVTSSSTVGASAFSANWLRVTRIASSGATRFWRSTDGSTWTEIGTAQTLSAGVNIFDGTGGVIVGALATDNSVNPITGNVFRAQIYSGVPVADGGAGETLAWDANFSTASKLATSFTESSSNAATVTINSSGDLGARISGERDLVQLTASKQPIYLPFSGTNYGWLRGNTSDVFVTPDSAAVSITGSLDLRAEVALADWTPSADNVIISKWSPAQKSYILYVNSTGRLVLLLSSDGAADSRTATSTASPTITDGSRLWVRATYNSSTGDVQFFTSSDGSSWTQLGTTVAGSAISLFDSTALLLIGVSGFTAGALTGSIFRAQVLNGIGGTVVADFNPALYTSGTTFTASTGEVWTLNGGSTIVNRTSLYFDGSDDYMKAAAFSLSQPETVYFTGQQVGFTDGDTLFDGNAQNNMRTYQKTSAPNLNFLGGVPDVAGVTDFTVGTTGLLTTIYNGASSSQRRNRATAVARTTGTTAANGFTLGADGNGGNFANQRTNEVCIYSAAHDTSVQDRVIQYAGRKWGISGV